MDRAGDGVLHLFFGSGRVTFELWRLTVFCSRGYAISVTALSGAERGFAGLFTGLSGGRPRRTSATLPAQMRRACLRLSTVPPPTCGEKTTFLCARRPG